MSDFNNGYDEDELLFDSKKDFKPWVRFTIGDEMFEEKEAERKMKELDPYIGDVELFNFTELECCGPIIKGKYEFMAAPLAGRGYEWQQCENCKKTVMRLAWMS